MYLREIKDILNCKSYSKDSLLETKIEHCYAADMMSDVLKSCKVGSLLITGLVNQQVIQVSELMDIKAILFVSGKTPDNDVIEKAKQKNLPILSTEKYMFDTCGILYEKGLRGKVI